jgi:outer membrane protein OmpA-like peptidoglycan-associated protein
MPSTLSHPRPSAGLIATGLVAASLTAAGLFAAALLAANTARAAEPYDASCDADAGYGQATPLIVTGFKTGSAAVPAEQEADIRAFAATLPVGTTICVVGQADKRGPVSLNDQLAMNRARAVAARLIGAGVAPQNLSLSSRAEAFGDAAPSWLWFDGSRRVEVIAER